MDGSVAPSKENLLIKDWSTLKFFLMNLLTYGAFLLIWGWKITGLMGNPQEKKTNRGLMIAIMATFMWFLNLSYSEVYVDDFGNIINPDVLIADAISGLLATTCWILLIVISFKLKNIIETEFSTRQAGVKLNGIWTFLFPLYYQYYAINNIEKYYYSYQSAPAASAKAAQAPQDDMFAKIEKLQKLKNSGAITEEEFQQQKAKILGNS